MSGYGPWEANPSASLDGWWTVGRIRKGPQHGTFIPLQEWRLMDHANMHVVLLNMGIPQEEALITVTRCCTRPSSLT